MIPQVNNFKKGLVSVIIPTFRRSDSLKKAIDSVTRQSYKNIEIIVVDDNAEYLQVRKANEKIIANYEGIIFVKNENNKGGGLSRNSGVAASSGEFIAFLDDDDEFLPDKIREQIDFYNFAEDKTQIGLVYSYAEVVRVDGTVYTWERDEIGFPLEQHVLSCVAPSSSIFMPKKVFLLIGGFEEISSRQDATLIMKVMMNGFSIHRVPKVLYRYFWHDGTNGITKISQKSLNAEIQYRDLFNVYKTKSGSVHFSVNNVLSIFTSRVVPIYIRLNMRREAWLEMVKSFKRQPFNKINYISLGKLLAGRLYIYLSLKKEKANRLGSL